MAPSWRGFCTQEAHLGPLAGAMCHRQHVALLQYVRLSDISITFRGIQVAVYSEAAESTARKVMTPSQSQYSCTYHCSCHAKITGTDICAAIDCGSRKDALEDVPTHACTQFIHMKIYLITPLSVCQVFVQPSRSYARA